MQLALIRGSLLRPWELPNYLLPDPVRTTFFASTQVAARDWNGADVCGLQSLADVNRRLSPRTAGGVEWLGGSLEYLMGLERALEGFDVAHATELANPVSLQAIRARQRGRCQRVVVSVMENILFGRRQNRLVDRRIRRVAAGVDHALAVSELSRAHLVAAGVPEDRISVIPVGVDTELFRPHKRMFTQDRPLRVVSVARLEPAKGVEDLVIAVGLARREGVDITLTLVGDGPMKGRLRALAAELGASEALTITSVDWPGVAAAYRDHDVFVLASAPTRNWREQYGFAIVEAMASGMPVVAGDSGTLPEVVGWARSLVRPHDPLALRDHLVQLAGDSERRVAEGSQNRERAVAVYSLDAVRSQLSELYGSVLERPAVGR